jgi:putative endonuclease
VSSPAAPEDRVPSPERRRAARERGAAAEALAAAWLAEQGYALLARNHRARRGEVDLVCRHGEALVFVEVRSRSREDYGTPAESVTVRKARRVVAAATDYAVRHGGLEQPMRFDVVAVHWQEGGPRLELWRNAFDADGRPSP